MSVLATTLADVAPPGGWFTLVAGEPSGDRWFPVTDLVADPDVMRGWLGDLLAGEAKGHRDVAASYLAGWLAGALAGPVAAAVHRHGCAWPVTADNLAVRHHPDGWFDGLAVLGAELRAAGDDPAALRDVLAGELVDLLTPIFDVLRTWAPYGTFGLWGSLADSLAADALQRARDDGRDGEATWQEVSLLIDALATRAPRLRVRPTPCAVTWSGGRSLLSVRGTCCLYYKVSGRPRDPVGESYCTSCPLRDDDDRRRRWAAWLEETVP